MAADPQPGVLRMADIRMTFGTVEVLKGVSVNLRRAEILGLLGQNGSGKSTLIKVLAGFNSPDPGSKVTLWGETLPLPLDPRRIRAMGVAFVHQHLALIPSLSVADNMLVGDDRPRRTGIRWRRECAWMRELFDEFGLEIEPTALVETLSPVERAYTAILRAVAELRRSEAGRAGEGILVLDEPTPFLSAEDVEKLFALLRRIRRTGASVIIVTHDIDEVLEITDRVAIMRDGQMDAVLTTAETTRQDILNTIVGSVIAPFRRAPAAPRHEVAARIEGVSGGRLAQFDAELRRGEVVGVTGLIGSGFAEIPYLLFGAMAGRGRLTLEDAQDVAHDVVTLTPAAAIGAGIGLIPGDRAHQSCVGGLSVEENATFLGLRRLRGRFGLRRNRMAEAAQSLIAEYDVRPARAQVPLATLSGGNQQKVVMGKWLAEDPRLLLLDEPTQGVDYGARQQIFAALDRAAGQGTAILCASTDYEQLAQICDRVFVFHRGRSVACLSGPALTRENIARACFHDGAAIPAHPQREAAS
ncbi:sugar ABC transporter ATP-binding protein [Paracoccus sp. 1_MG-2023]|uniref:sugar ABC transporter ATP-binding protein n=1 Tax=unclassified Paracoccus (in: a-proteobacteria) TaxID=2688777 RepID=UPI001C07FF80|nr:MULTISPECIES: sugar ABC transporter ATP-binding protein [unclassified Paracoccus (in: a-proteobacteria)]MBU2957639.1 sugar ABC transporter ATP-binding protein [Paracoccus sp. C2R09]MDO6667514.1 sugar ABC transporter ATP-binding protein [Paracoccus sp. 1_MG-2023]